MHCRDEDIKMRFHCLTLLTYITKNHFLTVGIQASKLYCKSALPCRDRQIAYNEVSKTGLKSGQHDVSGCFLDKIKRQLKTIIFLRIFLTVWTYIKVLRSRSVTDILEYLVSFKNKL